MNTKQLIITIILSIGMPVIAAAACPDDDACEDGANKTDGSSDLSSQTLKNDPKLYDRTGRLVLKPANSTSNLNTDIPTYTVPKK